MSDQRNAAALAAIVRGRSRLIFVNPFWGTLACGLEVVITDAVDTMGVDGTHLYANPEFTLGLTEPEVMGVLVHEVSHCANMHHVRRGDRDPYLWNLAADLRVNWDEMATGQFVLPHQPRTLKQFMAGMAGYLLDPLFSDMGTEEIYRHVVEAHAKRPQPPRGRPGQPGNGQGAGQNGTPAPQGASQDAPNGPGGSGVAGGPQNAPAAPGGPANGKSTKPGVGDPGGCGGVLDAAPAHDPVGRAEAERDWQTKVRQAAAIARSAGELPGSIKRIIDELNNPRIDWRQALRRFTDQSAHRDYAWSRPNRRHLARGFVLPGLIPDRPAHVAVIVDTSGSIAGPEIAQFGGELGAILNDGACDRISVIYADTRVQGDVDTWEPGDTLVMRDDGGGGTSFRQPLRWVAENLPDAAALIYLTDACTSSWGEEPGIPVLWAVIGEEATAREYAAQAPFGEALFIGD